MTRRILLFSQNPDLAERLERDDGEPDWRLVRCRPIGRRFFVPRRYDVAIVDGGLPGMAAFDVCRALRKHSPHLRVLM